MKQHTKSAMEKLNEAINYIEGHIQDKLTLEQIALAVDLSKYHLHRIFKAVTRQKIMDYVRNRKLAHSIPVLLTTDFKLIDIAFQFGFSYEQSYIRSFYRLFHLSPTQFRKVKPQVDITDKINLSCLRELDGDGFLTNPRIVIKPDFWVVGTQRLLKYDEADFYNKIDAHGNAFFYHGRQKISYAKSPHMYIGIIKYLENMTNCRRYITALEVERVEDIPHNMDSYFISNQKYAVFTYVGLHHPQDTTLKHLLRIYEYIFERWLPSSGYAFSGMYQMEFIDSSIARSDYCEIDLYIPIADEKKPLPSLEWLDGDRVCST